MVRGDESRWTEARDLFDDIIGGAWQLIGYDVDPTTAVPDGDLAWFARIGGSVTVVSADGPARDLDGSY